MSLTAQSTAPQRPASGMGVFFSLYFVIMTFEPPVAGWLCERTGKPFTGILFAVGLLAATALGFIAFGPLKQSLARGGPLRNPARCFRGLAAAFEAAYSRPAPSVLPLLCLHQVQT